MPDASGITKAAPRSIAAIGALRNREALLAALQSEFGTAPPTTPNFIHSDAGTLSCLSPDRYFATALRDAALPARLAKTLEGLAAVTDQSDLWEIFTLAAPNVREVLAQLVPVDLTPALFPVGALALTRAGHMNVRLWRVGEDVYELAVARSYAEDLEKEARVLF
jgi:sarcosine oxidase subunit gamma